MALAVTSAPWQQVNMPALDLRRYLGVGLQEGVVGAADMAIAQRAAGANFSVDIAAGEAIIQGDTVTNQGRYYVLNDAVFNLTGFTAANATNPRIDRVTLRVRDAFHGDAANDVSFQVVTGTATSGATLTNLTGAASVPASSLLLANVLIPATATTITTANIDTTVRPRAPFVSGLNGPPGTQIDYTEVVADVTTTATTAAGAGTIITGSAVTYDGWTPIWIEFYAPSVFHSVANTLIGFEIYDGSTDVALVGLGGSASTTNGPTVRLARKITPTAGAHTYSIRAWGLAAGTTTVRGNTGAAGGGFVPTTLTIRRA